MTGSPILVLGATGLVGGRIARAIAATGRPVRAASRRPSTPHQVLFDWSDAATHAPALEGAAAVHVLPPTETPHPEELTIPFLETARAAGIRRVSLLGASPVGIGDPGLGQIHAWLADSGLEWAVLRPTWFAQNFTRPGHHLSRAIAAGQPFVTATGDGRVPFVDASDIAAVGVRALLDDVSHDTDHVITGPQALTYDEAARVVSDVLGRPVRHIHGTPAEAASFMEVAGMDPTYTPMLAAMEVAIAGGSEDRVTDAVERVTGRPPRSLAQALVEVTR